MALTLWGAATARTLRAHWALQELGLEYEAKLIGSRTGATQTAEFRALNLKEKIPVLVDGELVLTESAAIVAYLGDRYGSLTPPPGSVERARYDEWASYVLMELDAHTLYVIRKHRDLAALYGESTVAVAAAEAGFRKQIEWAELKLGPAPYALGETFTGIDILLTSCLDWAHAYRIGLSPRMEQYRRRIHERPAYGRAVHLNFSVDAGA